METYQLLQQAYGEDAMGHTQVFDWFRRFKEGRTSVESDPRSGRPSTSRNEEMIAKVRKSFAITGDWQYERERMTVRRLCGSIRQKQLEKWQDGDWILHHENAPTHTSHLVQQFLAKHGTTRLQQPPYSPDLAPCDFFLFPRLKKVLKGHRFEALEDIKWNSMKTLLYILKEEFAKCFQQWQRHWAKCVAAEGTMLKTIRVKTP